MKEKENFILRIGHNKYNDTNLFIEYKGEWIKKGRKRNILLLKLWK